MHRRPLRHNQNKQGQGQGQRPEGGPRPTGGQGQNGKKQHARPHGGRNGGRKGNGRGKGRRAPPAPPAYIQRDLLLIANAAGAKGIEDVRLKFDPLVKKIPAHVTLIFPEPASHINREFLKGLTLSELPSLARLNFASIEVREEMYLWLLPDSESSERLKTWREALVKSLPEHSQEEDFEPHITLGYIPRSTNESDAIAFAKSQISLPLSLDFEKVLLEEFGENQISRSVDSVLI